MFDEARLAAFLDVGLHPVTAERNPPQTVIAAQRAHEFMAVAVGQPEIGNDDVDGVMACDLEGLGDAIGGFDLMPAPREEPGECLARCLMIFDEQNVQTAGASRRGWSGR